MQHSTQIRPRYGGNGGPVQRPQGPLSGTIGPPAWFEQLFRCAERHQSGRVLGRLLQAVEPLIHGPLFIEPTLMTLSALHRGRRESIGQADAACCDVLGSGEAEYLRENNLLLANECSTYLSPLLGKSFPPRLILMFHLIHPRPKQCPFSLPTCSATGAPATRPSRCTTSMSTRYTVRSSLLHFKSLGTDLISQ